MSGWDIIKSNFSTFMTGLNQGYHYYPAIDATKESAIPASVWNKAYVLRMAGMPEPNEYINSVLDLKYNVELQVCFTLKVNQIANYDAYISLIEEIIRKRLDVTSFHTTIVNIRHLSTSEFTTVTTGVSDANFNVVKINFEVTTRLSYN